MTNVSLTCWGNRNRTWRRNLAQLCQPTHNVQVQKGVSTGSSYYYKSLWPAGSALCLFRQSQVIAVLWIIRLTLTVTLTLHTQLTLQPGTKSSVKSLSWKSSLAHCNPIPMTCGSCSCREHITNSVRGVSQSPVLDCGTTFHLDYSGQDLPSTPSDNHWKLIYLTTEALSDPLNL